MSKHRPASVLPTVETAGHAMPDTPQSPRTPAGGGSVNAFAAKGTTAPPPWLADGPHSYQATARSLPSPRGPPMAGSHILQNGTGAGTSHVNTGGTGVGVSFAPGAAINSISIGSSSGSSAAGVSSSANGSINGSANGTVNGSINGAVNGTVNGTVPGSSCSGSVRIHSNGAPLIQTPSFRRHHRRRSSTICVQPRQAAPQVVAATEPAAGGLVRGVTTLAGAQLLAKLLAFALNQLLIRGLGARELGAASQIELLLSTALALGRDPLRLAAVRQSSARLVHKSEYTTDGRSVLGTVVGNAQEIINLGWLGFAVGSVLVASMCAVLQWRALWPASAIAVSAAAAITELAAEPCFLLVQQRLQLARRARVEAAANTARVAVTAAVLLVLHVSPYLGFAIGHLCYAAVLLLGHFSGNLSAARMDGFRLRPQRVWTSQGQREAVFVGAPLRRAAFELGVQQVVKFLLTEGDRIAVGLLAGLEEQGEYALAGNYGSLLARMVFLPVEEAFRGYFSRTFPKNELTDEPRESSASPRSATEFQEKELGFSSATMSPEDAAAATTHGSRNSSPPLTAESRGGSVPEDRLSIFTSVLRAYAYLGLLAAGFGPLVARYMLSFVVRTSRFGNAAQVLAAYACYIPVLAWNGVLEALVQSVAALPTLRAQGAVLAGLAVFFVALTYVLVSVAGLGAVGIVWAQIVCMALRVAWSLRFAVRYFARGPGWLRACLPPWWIALLAAACAALARSAFGNVATFQQFAATALLAGTVAVAALGAEYTTMIRLRDAVRPQQQHKMKSD